MTVSLDTSSGNVGLPRSLEDLAFNVQRNSEFLSRQLDRLQNVSVVKVAPAAISLSGRAEPDTVTPVDPSNGATTITLPGIARDGDMISITNITSSTNTITITPAAGDSLFHVGTMTTAYETSSFISSISLKGWVRI